MLKIIESRQLLKIIESCQLLKIIESRRFENKTPGALASLTLSIFQALANTARSTEKKKTFIIRRQRSFWWKQPACGVQGNALTLTLLSDRAVVLIKEGQAPVL